MSLRSGLLCDLPMTMPSAPSAIDIVLPPVRIYIERLDSGLLRAHVEGSCRNILPGQIAVLTKAVAACRAKVLAASHGLARIEWVLPEGEHVEGTGE